MLNTKHALSSGAALLFAFLALTGCNGSVTHAAAPTPESTQSTPSAGTLEKSTNNLRTCRDVALAKTQFSTLFDSASGGGGSALSTGQSLGLQLLLSDAAAAGPSGQLLEVATTFQQVSQDIQSSGSGTQTVLSAEDAVKLTQAVSTGADACSNLGITAQDFANLPPVGS